MLQPSDWGLNQTGSVDERARLVLRRELQELRDDAPSSVGGLVLTSFGGVLTVGGAVLSGLGASWGSNVITGAIIAIGVIIAVPGVVLLIVGIVNLIRTHFASAAHEAKIERLERDLRGLDQPPSPPPSIPPAVMRPSVPGFVLARF